MEGINQFYRLFVGAELLLDGDRADDDDDGLRAINSQRVVRKSCSISRSCAFPNVTGKAPLEIHYFQPTKLDTRSTR